jgi:signal transduction histidine kinase
MGRSDTRRLIPATRRVSAATTPMPAVKAGTSAGEAATDAGYSHLAALERLNRMVAGFASMVNHETRTALVGIQGAGELIRFGGLSEAEIQTCATDILEQAVRINTLISDMFDLNHLETGQVTFHKTAIDMNAIAAEVVGAEPRRADRPEVSVRLEPRLPNVIGDRDRLRQAVGNFVAFALRQASADTEVTLTTEARTGRIRVGIGSDAMKVTTFDDWLFGRYERYENKPSSIMGAGLGLAIARVIVELHGGRVWVERFGEHAAELNFNLPTNTRPANTAA